MALSLQIRPLGGTGHTQSNLSILSPSSSGAWIPAAWEGSASDTSVLI